MAMNTVTFSDAIKTLYETRLLTRAIPRMIYGNWGMKARLSKNGSYEIRKYDGLSAVTTALTEGTTPAENAHPVLNKVTITPAYYGAWIGFTDELEMENFDNVVSEATSILGEQAALSADTIIRNVLVADATADYSGTASSRGTLDAPTHDISFADIIYQIAALEVEGALPVDGQDYICIIHPHSWGTLMLDPIFAAMFIQESGSGESAIRNGYLGRIARCKFFMTSNAKEYADEGVGSTTDVYTALFIARESYATVGMAGLEPNLVDNQGDNGSPLTGQSVKPVEIIMHPRGSSGAMDPMDQRGSIAWKMNLGVDSLNANWLRCLEHTNMFSDA